MLANKLIDFMNKNISSHTDRYKLCCIILQSLCIDMEKDNYSILKHWLDREYKLIQAVADTQNNNKITKQDKKI